MDEVRLLVRSDTEVHVVAEPTPEFGLLLEVDARLHLGLPALHHVGIHGPETDSMAWHMSPPLFTDFGTHVSQPQGHIP